LVGPGICGSASIFFNLLTPFIRYDLIWVGPLSIDIAIITLYYAILRYRMITIDAWWMKIMSYIVMITTMALIYVILFFVASIVLFKSPYVPAESIILNFVMIALVFLTMPFLAELMASVRSLLSINSMDVGYIAKRLNRSSSTETELRELTVFLADHLHFSYVGILIGEKLYGSKEVEFTIKEIEIGSIESKSMPDQVWRGLNSGEGNKFSEYEDLRAIIELKGGSGQPFGRIIFGAPHREGQFGEEDFMQLEVIINLISVAVDPEKKRKTA
jgi:hypothetical protein